MKAKNTGMIIVGGGLIKHHICNANLMVRIRSGGLGMYPKIGLPELLPENRVTRIITQKLGYYLNLRKGI